MTGADVPLVSVCIPAYNHGRYVQDSIRSALEQDWPRMELLLVDDGSKDDTFSKALEMKAACEERFERVAFETKENGGTCSTFNRLRELARGSYFLLVASDDALLPGAVRALVEPMLNDQAVGVVVGVNEIMDGEGVQCFWDGGMCNTYDASAAAYMTFNDQLVATTGIGFDSPGFGTYREILKHNHVPNGWMVRKQVLDAIPPFAREAPLEDHWMHLQLSKLTRYAGIPDHVFRYRWHAANTAKQLDRMRWYEYLMFKWEESFVMSPAGAAWRDDFLSVKQRVVHKPILGRALYRETIYGLDGSVSILHVLGASIPYRRKVAHPFPPSA